MGYIKSDLSQIEGGRDPLQPDELERLPQRAKGCAYVLLVVIVAMGITALVSGSLGLGITFVTIGTMGLILVWRSGSAKETNSKERQRRPVSPTPQEGTQTIFTTTLGGGYAHSGEQFSIVGPFYGSAILKRHFELTEDLQNAPKSQQEAIAQDMVNMSVQAGSEFKRLFPSKPLPNHRGFYRLAVNYEQQKRYEHALTVCQVALAQGWNGDWEKRIERCQDKLDKTIINPERNRLA